MPNADRRLLMTALPVAAAVLLMGVSCYYQGMWSERWGESPQLQIFAQQLKAIPLRIGEWEGTEGAESSEQVKEISGAAGELNRIYRNAAGKEVRVMLMCARFRDIFNHSPDRCYPAAGFEMLNQPQPEVIQVGDTEAQFFTTTFRKSEVTGTHDERGYWTWTANGTWLAPSNERLVFGGEHALYKMYIFATVPPKGRAREESEFEVDFIREFIPAATLALRPAFEKSERLNRGEEVDLTPPPAAAQPAEAKADAEAKPEAEPAA